MNEKYAHRRIRAASQEKRILHLELNSLLQSLLSVKTMQPRGNMTCA